MIVVRFLRHAPPYVRGELAGFPDEQAFALRDAGAIELVVPEGDDAGTTITAPTGADEPQNEHQEQTPAAAEAVAPEAPDPQPETAAPTGADEPQNEQVAPAGPHKSRGSRVNR
ncbi:hypothetical protein [Azospirillum argentinense]|uniref:hypothetical protein n=1 Tax=Azospirillum argentinense TaxID=2970906 RepID=UPI0032DFE9C4